MKRAWLLVAVLLLTLGLVGCTVVKTYDDEGQEIDIDVGQEAEILNPAGADDAFLSFIRLIGGLAADQL